MGSPKVIPFQRSLPLGVPAAVALLTGFIAVTSFSAVLVTEM